MPLQTPGRKLNELILISGQEKTFSKSNITNTLVMLKKAISDKKKTYFQTNVNQLIFFLGKGFKNTASGNSNKVVSLDVRFKNNKISKVERKGRSERFRYKIKVVISKSRARRCQILITQFS